MAIHLSCPVCGTNRFKAPIQAAGKRCHCPECRSIFRLTDGMPVLKWGIVPNRTVSEPPLELAIARAETKPDVLSLEKTRVESVQEPTAKPPATIVVPDPP